MRPLRLLLAALASLPVGYGAAAIGLDLWGAADHGEGPWDYVVVAGAGVMPGGVPSDALRVRAELGADLWLAGAAPRLGLTGGVGDWGPAESVVAAAIAAERGVPPEAIVLEATSTSTEENARDLAALLGPDARVLVVTDRYHTLRCGRVFGRHFAHVGTTGATSPAGPRIAGALREVAAVAWYAATGRL